LPAGNLDQEHNPAGHLPSIDLAIDALHRQTRTTFFDRDVEPTNCFAVLKLLSESQQHQLGFAVAIGVAGLSRPFHSSGKRFM
jgi:hypothetical protein